MFCTTLKRKLITVKNSMMSMESHKITVLYFIVGSLKILNELNSEEMEKSVNYVLRNAVIENKSN